MPQYSMNYMFTSLTFCNQNNKRSKICGWFLASFILGPRCPLFCEFFMSSCRMGPGGSFRRSGLVITIVVLKIWAAHEEGVTFLFLTFPVVLSDPHTLSVSLHEFTCGPIVFNFQLTVVDPSTPALYGRRIGNDWHLTFHTFHLRSVFSLSHLLS